MIKDFIKDLTYLINYYARDYKKTNLSIKKTIGSFVNVLSDYQAMVLSYNALRNKTIEEGDELNKLNN